MIKLSFIYLAPILFPMDNSNIPEERFQFLRIDCPRSIPPQDRQHFFRMFGYFYLFFDRMMDNTLFLDMDERLVFDGWFLTVIIVDLNFDDFSFLFLDDGRFTLCYGFFETT